MMKDRTWIVIKKSANICLTKMNKEISKISDPVGSIYNNDLQKALNDIAVYVFIHGKDGFGPELLDVRNGIEQIYDDGLAACEQDEKCAGEWPLWWKY